MCIASEYLSGLETWYRQLNTDYELLRKVQSEIDRELSDISHQIEKSKFNVVQGYKLAKRMHDVLQKRRVIKGEMLKISSVRDSVKVKINLPQMNQSFARVAKKDQELRTMLNTDQSITIESLLT